MFIRQKANNVAVVPKDIEKKSYSGGSSSFSSIFDVYSSNGWSDLRAWQAWRYYTIISPIGRAVRLVSTEFADNIKPVLLDKQTGEYVREFDSKIPESKVLKILAEPNFNTTGSLFKKEIASSFMVTGDVFEIVSFGSSGPLEIFYENSKYVTIQSGTNGFPAQYTVSKQGHENDIYKAEVDIKTAKVRYLNGANNREIRQIRDFNPNYSVGNLFGFSQLSPVYYEIEQFLQSNIHNLSTLQKGARPSGVLSIETELTQEQKDYTKQQLINFYQGSENSGNVMVLEGGAKKEFKELSINNKDMDFVEMKKMVKASIYEALEIPASFYDNTASTFNNKGVDKESLYDFNVVPLSNRLLNETGRFLLSYFPNGDRYDATFIENEVPALRKRFTDQVIEKHAKGLISLNEARSQFGDESIGGAGDLFYQPTSVIPVGSDQFTRDNLKEPLPKKDLMVEELKRQGLKEQEISDLLKWHY